MQPFLFQSASEVSMPHYLMISEQWHRLGDAGIGEP